MLLYGIDKDYTEKIDLANIFSDMMKLYINPEMYRDEIHYKKTGRMPGKNTNMDFKRQQATGRLYGFPRPSPIVQKALDAVYKKRDDDKKEIKYVDLSDVLSKDKRVPRQAHIPITKITDEDVIG